jgi:hypothetical protein
LCETPGAEIIFLKAPKKRRNARPKKSTTRIIIRTQLIDGTRIVAPFAITNEAISGSSQEAQCNLRTGAALSCSLQSISAHGWGFYFPIKSAQLAKILRCSRKLSSMGDGTPFAKENSKLRDTTR